MKDSRLDWAFSLVLFLALGVRLLGIASRPLWYDEAFSALFAEKGPQTMLVGTFGPGGEGSSGVAAEEHPLLYYMLLWSWIRVWGDEPYALRELSILAGLGVVILSYCLSRALFEERDAIPLALLVGLSPFQVHYSQEVRMYGLLAMWLGLATWAFWKGIHRNRKGWWVVFSVSAALAMYTHSLAAVYLFPLALTPVLMRNWQAVKNTLLAGFGAILLYIPWLMRLPAQVAKVEGSYWIQRPGAERLVTTLLSFITNLPIPDSWLPFALFASLLTLTLAAWQTFRAWRKGMPEWRRGVWLAYLAFAPVILLFLLSQWQPVFVERALLPSGVVFLLWIGWALIRTGLPRVLQGVAFGLLLVGMGMGLYQHLYYQSFPYAPYASLDEALEKGLQPGDVIVHSNKLSLLPAVYYDRGLPQTFVADPSGSGSDTLGVPTQQALGLLAAPDIQHAVGDASRVWFVIFSRAQDEYQALGEQDHPHLEWLDAHYRRVGIEQWNDLQVYIFVH